MSYELWSNDIAHVIPSSLHNSSCLEISSEKITAKLVGWKNAIYWKIVSLNKARIYVARVKNRVVHTSMVVQGNLKFAFLEGNDIEIGPCWTDAAFRGKGIYPFVLTQIIQKELKHNSVAYMIIKDSNVSSQRGVSKVGFIRTGETVRTDRLRRYYKCNAGESN